MSLVPCEASLKACATNHRDCAALDGVSAYKALTLIFDWQQTRSATVKLALSQAILVYYESSTSGDHVSVCALEFSKGSVDEVGIVLTFRCLVWDWWILVSNGETGCL